MIPTASISAARGVPHGAGHAPAADQGLQPLPLTEAEQLAVPDAGQRLLLLQVDDGDAHAHRSGQGAAAHLVHAGQVAYALRP